MMNPAIHNFEIHTGQTLKYGFTVWEDDNQTIPYDFTGHTVKSEARIAFSSPVAVNLNASIVGNTVYLNATPVQLAVFLISPNNKSSKYVYDIEITKPDLTKWTLVRGAVDIIPEVTKT